METANVQRRCHGCPDVGAFLEIYIHLTKYYSTEGKSDMPVFPPRGHFTSAHFHASDVFHQDQQWTTKWVIFQGILGIVQLICSALQKKTVWLGQLGSWLQSTHVASSEKSPSRTIRPRGPNRSSGKLNNPIRWNTRSRDVISSCSLGHSGTCRLKLRPGGPGGGRVMAPRKILPQFVDAWDQPPPCSLLSPKGQIWSDAGKKQTTP